MIRLCMGIMGLIIAQSMVSSTFAQQSTNELGSALTWEQIQKQRREPRGVEPWRQRFAVPAAEPIPAFKYRFQSKPSQMRAEKGSVHLGRAMLMREQISESVLRKWEGNYAALDGGAAVTQDLAEQIKPFRSVLDELHALAECDDLQWRLPLNDLKGIKRFQYLLPEVQVSRDLGRMLRTAAISHASQGEFDEAVRSLRSGFRLAEMVGNGETLLHQLVGIAIHQLMLEAVLDVIVAPNSPNLYWAIAELPTSRPGMHGRWTLRLKGWSRCYRSSSKPSLQIGRPRTGSDYGAKRMNISRSWKYLVSTPQACSIFSRWRWQRGVTALKHVLRDVVSAVVSWM